MTTDDERLLTEADFTVTYVDGWYIVYFDEMIYWKKYSRDTAYTHVEIKFRENQSPPLPKTRENLQNNPHQNEPVEMVGTWTRSPSAVRGYNRLRIPIPGREARAEAKANWWGCPNF